MDVHPNDVRGQPVRRRVRVDPGGIGGGEVGAGGVEHKRPRPARGVQDPLVQRVPDRGGDSSVREPVGGVVLAERGPVLGGDHRFVQVLEHVVLDGGPVEAGEPLGEGRDELRTPIYLQHPVEEVGLDDPTDPVVLERPAGQDVRWCSRPGRGDVDPDDGVGNDLGGNDEQGVVEERVAGVAERRPERGLQQPRPQLPLERDLRDRLALGVERGKLRMVEQVPWRIDTEALPDLLRGRLHRRLGDQDRFQPRQQPLRVRRHHPQRRDLNQRLIAQVVQDPLNPVGEDPDVAAPMQLASVDDIAGQLNLGVVANCRRTQILLDLDDAVANLDVQSAPGPIRSRDF